MASEAPRPSVVPFPGTREADERWLRRVYDTQWAALVRLAGLLLGDTERADEIAQDAILATFQRRTRFGSEIPVAYLRQCVVNSCRSVQRHRTMARRRLIPLRANREEPERPDHVAVRHDEQARVMAALRTLPERQQEVLVLRYYSQLSEAEIAEALGISRGAVKSHAHRGLATLRARLDDHEGGPR